MCVLNLYCTLKYPQPPVAHQQLCSPLDSLSLRSYFPRFLNSTMCTFLRFSMFEISAGVMKCSEIFLLQSYLSGKASMGDSAANWSDIVIRWRYHTAQAGSVPAVPADPGANRDACPWPQLSPLAVLWCGGLSTSDGWEAHVSAVVPSKMLQAVYYHLQASVNR